MGDRVYRDFHVNTVYESDGCYVLMGEIDGRYFSVLVVKTSENEKLMKNLFNKTDFSKDSRKVDVVVSTIWTVWEVPDDRPDDFDGFVDNDNHKYIFRRVYM